MIDTIQIFLSAEHLPENYFLNNYNHLKALKEIFNRETEETIHEGELKNLRIRQSLRGVSIRGSLVKYYLGSNQKTLKASDVVKALKKLSDDLGLPILEARLNRLDIGENLVINHSADQYCQLLSTAKYFRRLEMNGGLGYENVNRYISFYDKVKEVKKKRVENVDKLYENVSVLRFEYRYLKPAMLSRCLGIEKVQVKHILQHYSKLVDAWYNIFFAINKKNTVAAIEQSVFNTKGGFDKQIAIIGIERIGGISTISNMINLARKAGQFRYPNEASNLLNKYITLMSNPRFTSKSTFIEELEKKIRITHFVNSELPQTNCS